jgi:uncharacterized protein
LNIFGRQILHYIPRISGWPAPARIISFLLIIVVSWSPFALLIYSYFRLTSNVNSPEIVNLLNIFVMGGLGLPFLFLLPWWGKTIHQQTKVFHHLGWGADRQSWYKFGQGWCIGVSSLMLLLLVQGWLGWLTWQPAAVSWPGLIGGGLLSSLGVGIIEELVFRGWILDELDRDYSQPMTLWVNSVIFAASHFGNPAHLILGWPRFLGLIVLGLLLVVAKRSQGNRLGISIGLHAGLIGVIYLKDVGQIIKFTNRIPEWVTGVGGTPVAGVSGVLALLVLLGYFARLSRLAHKVRG